MTGRSDIEIAAHVNVKRPIAPWKYRKVEQADNMRLKTETVSDSLPQLIMTKLLLNHGGHLRSGRQAENDSQ
jgi:hypothetical protein